MLLVGTAGLGQPAERVITRDRLLAAPPELVWRVLNDLDGMPLWRSDLVALERLPDQAGDPVWREQGRGAARGMRILSLVVTEPGRRLVFGPPAGPVQSSRSIELVPDGRATRIVLRERRIEPNPFLRIWRQLRSPGAELDRFLADLARRLAGPRELSAHPE